MSAILRGRGLVEDQEIKDFLEPQKPSLERLLKSIAIDKKQLSKAKKIVEAAIAGNQDILVFGDYDADGITSTAIMWQSLMMVAKGSKARVMPFIPDRARHGYGLSDRAIQDIYDGTAFGKSIYPDFNPSLIITVDNGIVANKVIASLKEKGTTIILTDHHQPGEEMPIADCIVHSIGTSGAGIAWIVSLSLTNELAGVYNLVELTTIGIVADQIPLVGINRDIVVEGLKRLTTTNNLGIIAMKKRAGIEGKEIGTHDINYCLAPRLNAVGRLDNPLDALRLLCSRDPLQIETIADRVEEHNSNRQILTDTAIKTALSHPVGHAITVEASTEYHEGIIGLIASKLVEAHKRPAIVISIGEETSKGSARSLAGVNITEVLRTHTSYLTGVGGHELAGGFSLMTNNIPKLTKALYAYADKNIDLLQLDKALEVEGQLTLSQVTRPLADKICSLEPFGMGNLKPRFVVTNLTVLEDRVIGKNGNHRKLVVEQGGITRDVIWFNGEAEHPLKHIDSLVCTIELNEWRDRSTVQLNAQYVKKS